MVRTRCYSEVNTSSDDGTEANELPLSIAFCTYALAIFRREHECIQRGKFFTR